MGLDVLGQIPEIEDLAVTKAEDVHLVDRDRRAVGTARGLVEDHRGVVVVGGAVVVEGSVVVVVARSVVAVVVEASAAAGWLSGSSDPAKGAVTTPSRRSAATICAHNGQPRNRRHARVGSRGDPLPSMVAAVSGPSPAGGAGGFSSTTFGSSLALDSASSNTTMGSGRGFGAVVAVACGLRGADSVSARITVSTSTSASGTGTSSSTASSNSPAAPAAA